MVYGLQILNMQKKGHIGILEVSLYVLLPVDAEYVARRSYRYIGSIFICFRAGRC